MKRFYKVVRIQEEENRFSITLDDRRLKSPGQKPLLIPNRSLAEGIANEWIDQGDIIDPTQMPFMCLAATTVDRVITHRDQVIDIITAYAETDLLCYWAEQPEELIRNQELSWKPLLNWCSEGLKAPLLITKGIMPISQSRKSICSLRNRVANYDNFSLAAIHELTGYSGSIVIALAIAEGYISVEKGIEAAQIDNVFQLERWGEDGDARSRILEIEKAMTLADQFLKLCNPVI